MVDSGNATKKIRRTGVFSRGYAVAEVDSFLRAAQVAYRSDEDVDPRDVLNVTFSSSLNGYQPATVDKLVDELHRRFLHRKRKAVIASQGSEAWLNSVYEEASTLYPRLLRPHGERFAPAKKWGYRTSDVDAFMDHIAAYFNGDERLTSLQVRRRAFPAARGEKAYQEAVVDVFLDRVFSVLVAVEQR